MSSSQQAGGRVLVTGGAGFIGTTLARELADAAEQWVVLDNLHPQVHPGSQPPADLPASVDLRVGDVTSADDLDAVVADLRPDTVVHLAAETGTAQSLSESTRHGMVNVVGTTQLLDALTRAGHVPAHFVLTSSRAVYGEGVWRNADGSTFQPGLRTHAQLEAGKWDHGDDAAHVPNTVAGTHPNPINVYGATKLAQEQILSAWTGSHDTSLSVLRLQNVYGPRQSLVQPLHRDRVAVLAAGTRGRVDPALRGRRHHPRLRPHRRRRERRRRGDRRTSPPTTCAPSTSAAACARPSATSPVRSRATTPHPSRTSPVSTATATSGTPPATSRSRSARSTGTRG